MLMGTRSTAASLQLQWLRVFTRRLQDAALLAASLTPIT